jgi:hypothetical protein
LALPRYYLGPRVAAEGVSRQQDPWPLFDVVRFAFKIDTRTWVPDGHSPNETVVAWELSRLTRKDANEMG